MKCDKCGSIILDGNTCQNCGNIITKRNNKKKVLIIVIPIIVILLIAIISIIVYNDKYIKGYIGTYECGEYDRSISEEVIYDKEIIITDNKMKIIEENITTEGIFKINNSYKVSNRIKEYFLDFTLTKRIINGSEYDEPFETEYFLKNTENNEYLLMDEDITYKCLKK